MRICGVCENRFAGPGWRCPACGNEPAADGFVRLTDLSGFEPYELASPDEFAQVAELEPRSFWFRARNEMIAWALRRYFQGARTFFEVGCGTGIVLAGLHERDPELRLTGGDPYAPALELARQKVPDAELLQLRAEQLPFEEEFDVVGAFDVLEHLADDRSALAELHRTVRPGGGLLLVVPQHRWLWSAADTWAKHERRYRRSELVRRVADAGFSPLRVTSFVSFLLPLMTLARLRQRDPESYDPCGELRVSRTTDSLLYGVLKLEHALIRRRVSFPFGGSLLLVARRPA